MDDATRAQRDHFFDAIAARFTDGAPDRFTYNRGRSGRNYAYFHDGRHAGLNVYVALQVDGRLAVECVTEPERRHDWGCIEFELDAVQRRLGEVGPAEVEPPGTAGLQGPRKRGVLRVARPAPDLSSADSFDDGVIWSVDAARRMHAAVEPAWSSEPGRRVASPRVVAQIARAGFEAPRPFRRTTVPDPVVKVVDGDALAQGWAEHEDTVADLDRLARAQRRRPFFISHPRVDLAWETDEGLMIVEVKSVEPGRNEDHQVRLALGQVLDYAHRLEGERPVIPVVAVSRDEVDPRWTDVCASARVRFVTPATFEDLVR